MQHIRTEMCMHMIYKLPQLADILQFTCCQKVSQPLWPTACIAMLDKNELTDKVNGTLILYMSDALQK